MSDDLAVGEMLDAISLALAGRPLVGDAVTMSAIDLLQSSWLDWKLEGYCPACGQETLILVSPMYRNRNALIGCSNPDCPRPAAAREILADPETEHVVDVNDGGFTIQHPLRERLDAGLFACRLMQELQAAGVTSTFDRLAAGRYRVTRREHDPVSESFRSPGSLPGWMVERLT